MLAREGEVALGPGAEARPAGGVLPEDALAALADEPEAERVS
jgi:hypothetical protein